MIRGTCSYLPSSEPSSHGEEEDENDFYVYRELRYCLRAPHFPFLPESTCRGENMPCDLIHLLFFSIRSPSVPISFPLFSSLLHHPEPMQALPPLPLSHWPFSMIIVIEIPLPE